MDVLHPLQLCDNTRMCCCKASQTLTLHNNTWMQREVKLPAKVIMLFETLLVFVKVLPPVRVSRLYHTVSYSCCCCSFQLLVFLIIVPVTLTDHLKCMQAIILYNRVSCECYATAPLATQGCGAPPFVNEAAAAS